MFNNRRTSARYLLATTSVFAMLMMPACQEAEDTKDNPVVSGNAEGFGSEPPKEAGKRDRYMPITEPNSVMALGTAVDLDNQKGYPTGCLEGTTQLVRGQEGVLDLESDYTMNELDSFVGMSASGGVKFLSWGASARGHFSRKLREKNYALNYVAFNFVKDRSEIFHPVKRSSYYDTLSGEDFVDSCGTGYVAAQDFGAMVLIKFSLELNSRSEQKSWGASAKGNYLSLFKLQAAISGNSGSKRSKGRLSVSALQIGGKPSELGKILGTQSKGGLIQNFALCDVYDVEKCLKGLKSVEEYLGVHFPKQLEEEGNSAVLRTYPFVYPKTLGSDHNPGISDFVIRARTKLRELYETEMEKISAMAPFAQDGDENAQEIIEQVKENVSDIRDAASKCYETATYQECTELTEEVSFKCAETVIPAGIVPEDGSQTEGTPE